MKLNIRRYNKSLQYKAIVIMQRSQKERSENSHMIISQKCVLVNVFTKTI